MPEAQIKEWYKDRGDLGLIIQDHHDAESTISISEVYEELMRIALIEGTGSVLKKARSCCCIT